MQPPQAQGLERGESWAEQRQRPSACLRHEARSCRGSAGQGQRLGPSCSHSFCLRLCSCPRIPENCHLPPFFLYRHLPWPGKELDDNFKLLWTRVLSQQRWKMSTPSWRETRTWCDRLQQPWCASEQVPDQLSTRSREGGEPSGM